MDHVVKERNEIITGVAIPPQDGWRSTYLKLRRRQAVDFPILGVAAAVRLDGGDVVSAARLALGAVSPAPIRVPGAEAYLEGKRLVPEVIAAAAEPGARAVRPFDNTDLGSRYRKWMTPIFISRALERLAAPA
jgi:4-hydroxybenzoyl-CoA reductase subunit beta